MGYPTKIFLKKVQVSESTMRRWLSEKTRIPELNTAKRDWRGWRIWDESHVRAVIEYKNKKSNF